MPTASAFVLFGTLWKVAETAAPNGQEVTSYTNPEQKE